MTSEPAWKRTFFAERGVRGDGCPPRISASGTASAATGAGAAAAPRRRAARARHRAASKAAAESRRAHTLCA